jgi:hypothetical protein
LVSNIKGREQVFGNRVMGPIFGPKRDKVMGEWRKWHNGELHNLYSSPDIIRHIKSRRLRWHAWGRGETCTGFWWESPRERRHLKDQGVDGIKMDLMEIGGLSGMR